MPNHYYYNYCSLLCHVNGGQKRPGSAKKQNKTVAKSVDYMCEQDMGGAEDANKSGGHFWGPVIFKKPTAVRKVDLPVIRDQRLLPSQTLCCLSHTNAPCTILCVLHNELIKIFNVLFPPAVAMTYPSRLNLVVFILLESIVCTCCCHEHI